MSKYIALVEGDFVCNIPKGMTNGEVIQDLFPSVRVNERNVELLGGLDGFSHRFNKEWWNAPYQKGGE